MPGPPPKDPKLRTRRNKEKTRSDLDKPKRKEIPALPIRLCVRIRFHGAEEEEIVTKEKTNRRGRPRKTKTIVKVAKPKKGEPKCKVCADTGQMPWHPETTRWWEELWGGHLSGEYLDIDQYTGIAMAVKLYDRINWQGYEICVKDAQEFRAWCREMGLTIMARRTLQWQKPDGEENNTKPPVHDQDDDTEEPPDPRVLQFKASGDSK